MEKSKKTFIINTLRRGTYRWPGRWLAEKRSALGKGFYYCENEICGVIVKKNQTQMDHTEPVIPVYKTTADTSLDEIAERMFCSPDGFKRLCKDCHSIKTRSENEQRPSTEKPKKGKKRAKKT